uniref:Membrane protein BRI3 n=1 Tax=Equus caballus TaxID=9796 RepID=A0A9L0RSY0_HORSE
MSAPVHLLLECKGAFPSPVLGSLPRPRGVSLKLAMSTVQAAGIPTHHPRVYNIHSRNVTRYPANSIVVVGGCPVCSFRQCRPALGSSWRIREEAGGDCRPLTLDPRGQQQPTAGTVHVDRVGVLEDSFTFLGIFLAIVLFPFGFICCFALRKRRCPNCGANFT